MYCKYCNKELPSPDADICTNCGKILEKPKPADIYSEPAKRPSKAWYLVPIFFGIVGGLVMYLALKDENKKMAKKGLILGIIISAVGTAIVMITYAVIFASILNPDFTHKSEPMPHTISPSNNLPATQHNPVYFAGVAYFNNAAGGGGATEERVVKQLPSALPSTRWTADFDYKFTASYIPNHRVFALTTTSDDPEAQSPANRIVVNHGYGSDNLFILVNGGVDSTPIPISPNVQYYVRLDKTPTMLTLSVFSDPARTIQIPGSPSTFAISPTAYNNNLQYIQHSGCTICGSSRTLTAQIDNTRIYSTPVSGTPPQPPTGLTATAVSSSQIIFQDDYSSNSGWTQVGTEVTVNSAQFPGVAYFNNAAGGGGATEERVVKQIPSALPSRWTADFDYKFTASSIPAHLIFVLSNTSVDPQSQSYQNRVIVEHGNGANQLFVEGPLGTDSSNIPISQNVQYYIRLDKTPTQLTLSVFSDASRTVQVPGSPVILGISPTDYNNNLNYIQHDGCLNCGSARILTAQIDNTKISVMDQLGNKQTFFEDNYSSNSGWTQIGSSVTVDAVSENP